MKRSDGTKSSTSRQRSASSALDFRSSSTPETFLELPGPPPNSTRGGLFTQRSKLGSSLAPKRPLGSSKTASSISTRPSDQSATATFKGKSYGTSREAADGKICLHTHHHHYWIISDSVKLPKLRSSRERMPLQQAEETSRFDGTMDLWPSEGKVEMMVEAARPLSQNTNQRYLIKG